MYASKNFKTKTAFKAAVKEGDVEVYQPGGQYPTKAGRTCVEGPHYPDPHTWYADCVVVEKDGTFVVAKGSRVN